MDYIEIAVSAILVLGVWGYVYNRLRKSDGDYDYAVALDEDGNEVEEVIDLKDV